MNWAIVPATAEHADAMAPNVAAPDMAELRTLTDTDVYAVLRKHIEYSLFASTWLIDDEPAAMGGLYAAQLLGDTGYAWMLGTELIRRHRVTFLRNYVYQLDKMLAIFPIIETHVDARYKSCLRWLKWTGFEIEQAEPMGTGHFHRAVLLRG
jgi:hypothetical protein